MQRIKRILVPTDFSNCAAMALRYAVFLAKHTGAEISLIHVCDLLDGHSTNLRKIIREYNKEKIAELTASLKHLKERMEHDDVVIKTELYNGLIIDSILLASKEHHADLIVMGTLGATGLKKLFFGTKAAAVINESSIPVITIPNEYKKPALKKIVMAVNDRKPSPPVYEPAFVLRKIFDATLRTVVFTADNDKSKVTYHEKIAEQVKKQLVKHFPVTDIESEHIHGEDFHETIRNYLDKQKTDLLVMLTHQRSFMQNLFRLSMTREMAYHITIPLLSLKGDA